MMTWSCTVTPSGLAATTISFVHGDVGLGRGRVARGVVTHQDQRRRAQLQRAFDHLAGVDRRVVDGAALLLFVGDQPVLAVEEEQVKLPVL